jgi:23S rRNA (adenine2503-C2)-methyltransferase
MLVVLREFTLLALLMTHCRVSCSYLQVTVSTVGLVDELEEFQARSKAQLAVSLHATTDEVRDWIVPVNRRHNLSKLMAALHRHYPRDTGAAAAAGDAGGGGSKRSVRRVLIEYTMLKGINDSLEDAER